MLLLGLSEQIELGLFILSALPFQELVEELSILSPEPPEPQAAHAIARVRLSDLLAVSCGLL
jgi:hypothetical protein